MDKDELKNILELHEKWLNDEDGGIRADLSESYLHGVDLSGADLRKAYLHRAYLHEADLSEADLSGADLRKAYLRGAYLSEADLSEADLHRADLYGAKGVLTFTAGETNRLCFTYVYNNEQRWQLGCFNGNYKETLEAVKSNYGKNSHYYKMIVATKGALDERSKANNL